MGLEFIDPYAPLPAELPVPIDDGAYRHLVGMRLPAITLQSSNNDAVDLSQITLQEQTVFFFSRLLVDLAFRTRMVGIRFPGVRGCTPQLCDYRDATTEFQKLGVKLFGVSSRRHEDLVEIAQRNRIDLNACLESIILES